MGYKVILTLLEGPHDAAFISRILKENGFTTTKKIIKDLPSPLNLYLSNPKSFQSALVEDMKIGTVQQSFFPKEVLEKGDNTVVLFSTGGVTKTEVRNKIITQFNAVKVAENSGEANNEKGLSISVLFLLDAEEEGLAIRLAAIAKEISDAMNVELAAATITNGGFVKIDDIDFGAFVFTKPATEKGRLEDVLLPLMQQANEPVFEDATTFLSKINSYALFTGKTNNADVKQITKVDKQDFNFEKSLISTAGQLQTSGKSNVQVIRESSYLTKDKILANDQCKLIAKFFEDTLIKVQA